jgi:hypothetical protein
MYVYKLPAEVGAVSVRDDERQMDKPWWDPDKADYLTN